VRKLQKIFFSSSRYWEGRYAKGGNSGTGSYGILSQYKANIINQFIKDNIINTVIEFGCGDGNQLSLYDIPHYVGFDVSEKAITWCKEIFKDDNTKSFFVYYSHLQCQQTNIDKADLTLSVDVLFHLVEDNVLLDHLASLFYYSNKYVIIYSTNFDKKYDSPHQIDREFTKIIKENINDFELLKIITNPHKGREGMSDFFVYKRISTQ
jgi:hypothetical protein